MSGSTGPTEPDVVHQGAVALTALGIGALLIVAAGVAGVSMGTREGHPMMWSAPAPVAQGTAVGFQLGGLPADIAQNYGFARANPAAYEQIPCFCGCGSMLAHRNLEDCFVTPDGGWESHASGCQICIQESQMVMQMMDRGMGPDAMRERIVSGFGGSMMAGG